MKIPGREIKVETLEKAIAHALQKESSVYRQASIITGDVRLSDLSAALEWAANHELKFSIVPPRP